MKVVGKVFEAKPANGETDDAHIGQRLREIRKLAGLTQEQLAERLNIGQAALSRVEKRRDILVSTLRDYLGALGATLRIDARFDDASALVANVHEAEFRFDTVDENQLVLPIIGEDRLPSPLCCRQESPSRNRSRRPSGISSASPRRCRAT